MNDDLPDTPTTREAWRVIIQENRELKKENGLLWEGNKRLSAELAEIEKKKKLWLKRVGWLLVFICAWLIWYAHKHPGPSDPDFQPMGWF